MFGLPVWTAVIVFGGFAVAALVAVIFGLTFNPKTEDWWTFGASKSPTPMRKE